MAKKTFLSRARLVKGERWTINYYRYDPATGEETRHREGFGLDEIQDEQIREEVAKRLVEYIEVFAPAKAPKVRPAKESMSVRKAVQFAVTLKQRLPRKNSIKKYITVSKSFLKWCERNGYTGTPIEDFGRAPARAYWDAFSTAKDYRGRTLNNYLATLRALWSELLERDVVQENPWTRIKPARTEEKIRRTFTDDERRTVAAYIEQTDYWLFRGVLLQFFCYVRPAELVRLKFGDFDFSAATVTIKAGNAKSWRRQVKTIPASVLHYFCDGKFEKYPTNYYVFGRVGEGPLAQMQPGTAPISELRPYKRHARILQRLKDDGRLSGDLSGLTWYSWKDTGISMHTRKTSPVATKDQAGHQSLAITSLYYHPGDTNPEYQTLQNDLLT